MANESIIKAAGQAYAPNPGQYDLSGFIQGITAIAGGLVKRQQEAAKRGKLADELYLSSDNTVVQGIVTNLQDQVRSGTLTQNKAKQKLADLDKNYNKDLPQIELMVKDIFKKGISRSAGELEENYLLGLSLGELDNPVVINGEEFSTFYSVNPATNSLTILSPNGEYVSPRELKSLLNNTPTINDRDEGNKITSTFLKKPYKDGDYSTFPAASNDFKNGMKSVFENKKKRDSWLLDNPQGVEITTFDGEKRSLNWMEFYLQNGLDEAQLEVFNTELSKPKNKDIQEKAKLMIVKDLMKGDTNLDGDIDKFLDKFINAKTPKKQGSKKIVNMVTAGGFTMPGKLLASEKQDIAVIDDVEKVLKQVKADNWNNDKPIELMGGAVLLTPVKGVEYPDGHEKAGQERKNMFRFTKNMKGQTKEDQKGNQTAVVGPNYSALFNPFTITPDGMNKIYESVLTGVPNGVTFGSSVYINYMNFRNK